MKNNIFVKTLIFLIYLLFISKINGEVGDISNLKYFRAWQFKNDRNGDFGIDLPNEINEGLFKSNLIDNKPEYCCGTESKYSDSGELLVNNQATNDQWFQNAIGENDYCYNYEVLLPVKVTSDGGYRFSIESSEQRIENTLKYEGFNNRTLYPEYIEDPDKYLFCWSFGMDLFAIEAIALVQIEAPGEFWVYLNNSLYTDFGGTKDNSYVDGIISKSFQYNNVAGETYKFDIFGCSRSNILRPIFMSFFYFIPSCDFSTCGTCGPANCLEECIDNTTSCFTTKNVCGTCAIEQRICDDNDPCTVDSCVEGSGCQHLITDPNCYCNEDNCQTTDLCNPKICSDTHTCISEPIICAANESCSEPHCLNGECICNDNPPVTSTTSQTITSPVTSISTDTITTSTATTSNINPSFICDNTSCPNRYLCIQLHKAFTCVSKQFEEQCQSELLKEINWDDF